MAYNPVNWEDEPSHNTAINSDNLNKMDAGIAANDAAIAGFQGAITSIQTANQIIGEDVSRLKSQVGNCSIVICTKEYWRNLAVRPANTLYIFNG